MKYCPECRAELRSLRINGNDRLVCSSGDCAFVHWNNPIPVVAGLVERDGEYVLARGADWPENIYSLITGYLEPGEAPEHAIRREVQEELGLATDRVSLIGHFPLLRFNQLIIAYSVVTNGDVRLDAEIAEVRLLSRQGLADFDFGPLELTREIVLHWLRR